MQPAPQSSQGALGLQRSGCMPGLGSPFLCPLLLEQLCLQSAPPLALRCVNEYGCLDPWVSRVAGGSKPPREQMRAMSTVELKNHLEEKVYNGRSGHAGMDQPCRGVRDRNLWHHFSVQWLSFPASLFATDRHFCFPLSPLSWLNSHTLLAPIINTPRLHVFMSTSTHAIPTPI